MCLKNAFPKWDFKMRLKSVLGLFKKNETRKNEMFTENKNENKTRFKMNKNEKKRE
jgi:hypothetical protein